MMEFNIDSFLISWNLTLEEPPFETPTGLVAKVRQGKQQCILKIAREGGDENTAAFLKHYDGYGAVKLLEEEGRATLFERAVPGTHLSELVHHGEDEKATHILCDVIDKLHTHQAFEGTYPSIKDL